MSLRRFGESLLIALAGVSLVHLLAVAWHETLGSFYHDTGIYLAVGRGILNGLTPYSDLFETKPPGIFLLSALSILLTDGPMLLLWVEAILIAALPLWLVYPVLRAGDSRTKLSRAYIAFLFGVVLALYTADKAGQGIVESFGAFFATGAVAIFAANTERWRLRDSFVPAVFIFIACFLKEPFLLAIIGGVVIVSPSFKNVLRLIFPVVIAGLLGLMVLALTGTLMPYVTIYLPHMLGHQIAVPWGTTPDPLWLRMVDLPRQWAMMHSFSTFLPFVIFSVWIAALVLPFRRVADTRSQTLVFLRWLLGSFLLTLGVGLSGDFYAHHFIFAVPVFAAFFFVCMREGASRSFTVIWVILLAVTLFTRPIASLSLSADWRSFEGERVRAAEVIDSVMDRCEIDRYLLLINSNDGIYAYTRHSPHGPLFTQYARFVSGLPLFIEAFKEEFHTAPLAIVKDGESRPLLDGESARQIEESFTEEPWPCAAEDFTQPLPYHLLFREVHQ